MGGYLFQCYRSHLGMLIVSPNLMPEYITEQMVAMGLNIEGRTAPLFFMAQHVKPVHDPPMTPPCAFENFVKPNDKRKRRNRIGQCIMFAYVSEKYSVREDQSFISPEKKRRPTCRSSKTASHCPICGLQITVQLQSYLHQSRT